MTERTELERVALKVFEGLAEAEHYALGLMETPGGEQVARRMLSEIERLFGYVAELMHEEDCRD